MLGDFHIIKVASRSGAALFTVEAITAEFQGQVHKEIFDVVVNTHPGASEEEIAAATQAAVENYLRKNIFKEPESRAPMTAHL